MPRSNPIVAAALALGLVMALAPSATWSAGGLEFFSSLGITSDYVHRGLTQSSGEPAIQGGLGLRTRLGFYGSVWGSTIDTERQLPETGDGSGYELDTVVGLNRPIDRDGVWTADASAGYYSTQATHQILGYDYAEYSLGISWRERVRASVAWSPMVTDHTRINTKLFGPRWAYELGGEWPLTRWLSATGGVGYCDLSEVSEVRYSFWSAGVNLRHGRFALALTQFGTDPDARGRFADGRAADRFAATLITTFGR